MEHNDSFEYTYSAPEQEELRRIRAKYLPRSEAETRLDQLRRLDAQAERPGTIASLCLGTLGTLIFGLGMCLCLVWSQFLAGIPVGILGAVLAALAYPVYQRITRKNRERVAPQILALTREME